MAGKMSGMKGMGSAKMQATPPMGMSFPAMPPRPKSANIRQLNGGFHVQNAGPAGDAEHVAKNLKGALRLAQDHFGEGSPAAAGTPAIPDGGS